MREEFLALNEAHHERVVVFLMENGATLHEAQDATQEAFLEAWTWSTTGRWEKIEHPAGWIRAVALQRYRRPPGPRRRPLTTPTAPPLLHEHPAPGPEPAELTAQTTYVIDILRNLDEECRAVMTFAMDGFSAVQTAAALGIDPQKVRNLRKKARAQLARALAGAREEKGGKA